MGIKRTFPDGFLILFKCDRCGFTTMQAVKNDEDLEIDNWIRQNTLVDGGEESALLCPLCVRSYNQWFVSEDSHAEQINDKIADLADFALGGRFAKP